MVFQIFSVSIEVRFNESRKQCLDIKKLEKIRESETMRYLSEVQNYRF